MFKALAKRVFHPINISSVFDNYITSKVIDLLPFGRDNTENVRQKGNEMNIEQASKWLQGGSIVVIASGILVATGAHAALNGLLVLLADAMFWPLDGVETGATREFQLMSAIGGGVMVGWGVALWILSSRGMREAPEMSKTIIWVSILSWFSVDSGASFLAAAYPNILSNTVFFAIFALPLLALRKAE